MGYLKITINRLFVQTFIYTKTPCMGMKRFKESLQDLLDKEMEAMTSESDDPKDWLTNLHWIASKHSLQSKGSDPLIEYMEILNNYLQDKKDRPLEIFYCSAETIEKFKKTRSQAHQLIACSLIFNDLIDNPPNTEKYSQALKEGINKVVEMSKLSEVYQDAESLDVPSIQDADDLFFELHEKSGLL